MMGSLPVATENRIRAGADAAMGYLRFGMIDLLKLLGGLADTTAGLSLVADGYRYAVQPTTTNSSR